LIIILFVSSFSFGIQSIYGHTEIKVGNYTIEAGWAKEPPLLNNLNDVIISVFDENDDSPVRNAMKDLSININYGGLSKKLNFVPSEQGPGVYLADIIPSKLGTYSLNLKGAIGTQSINNDIQIEDIEDANKITFPFVSDESVANIENIAKQITPIMNDLSNQIDELKNEINSTREIMQKANDEGNSIKSSIDRSSILSYIATGLGASAIILAVSLREMKIKLRRQ
jgi:outer membrane murein-binding lipoprotein Lpp